MKDRYLTSIFTILALNFLNATLIHGQTELSDSSSFSTTLQEIVVNAPETPKVGNKNTYYPTDRQKKALSTSSQLLAGLQIPELIVNPATGEIAISGGGKLAIRINGRPASITELMAISARDVTKVVYVSNPGVRYGDVAGVVDIIVKRKNEGYGIVLNLLQSPNRGWGDYTLGVKHSVGRSEWSGNYHSNPMWGMDCYRDNVESIDLGNYGKIERRERGIKTPNRMVTHTTSLQYSYANKSLLLFNVQAKLLRQNDRYASTGNIMTDINGFITQGIETEIAPYSSWQGDLDFYLHWKINNHHKVYFNIVPSFLNSTSKRLYESESIFIDNPINTKGYSLLAEALWECRIGRGMLTSGVRETLRNTKAEYCIVDAQFKNHSSESHFFTEWEQRIGNWHYIVGIDATLFSLSYPVPKSYFNIVPKLVFTYSPFSWGGVSLAMDGNVVNPTITQLNPIRQQIDRYQYSEGNIGLNPFRTYKSSIEFDFNINNIRGKLSLIDKYSQRPIMGGKKLEDDKIMQSYYNSGFHNDFIIKGQFRMPFFIKSLTLSIEGGRHLMKSNGVNYRHQYSQAFINAQLMLMVGKWWIMAKYNTAYNELWGEMISSVNNNLLNLGVGYRYKDVSFMAGIVNPIGNVSLKSRDLSSLVSYERTYHAASTNCLAWLGISLNLYKGKKRSATQKKFNNNPIYETIKNVQK